MGVTDKQPRQVVGSLAWSTEKELNSIKSYIVEKLRFRVEVTELQHPDGRVLVFEVPTRPVGRALDYQQTRPNTSLLSALLPAVCH